MYMYMYMYLYVSTWHIHVHVHVWSCGGLSCILWLNVIADSQWGLKYSSQNWKHATNEHACGNLHPVELSTQHVNSYCILWHTEQWPTARADSEKYWAALQTHDNRQHCANWATEAVQRTSLTTGTLTNRQTYMYMYIMYMYMYMYSVHVPLYCVTDAYTCICMYCNNVLCTCTVHESTCRFCTCTCTWICRHWLLWLRGGGRRGGCLLLPGLSSPHPLLQQRHHLLPQSIVWGGGGAQERERGRGGERREKRGRRRERRRRRKRRRRGRGREEKNVSGTACFLCCPASYGRGVHPTCIYVCLETRPHLPPVWMLSGWGHS